MYAATRLFSLFSRASSRPSQNLRPFSSSPADEVQRKWTFFSDFCDGKGESLVYQHALKFQRPSTIRWRQQFQNSVSFIGTVDRPIRKVNIGRFGVYTSLKVKTSHDSNRTFRILLKMWEETAEICINHLKPNDLIYVSGHLGSYSKADQNGNPRTNYEVIVNEINFVAQHGQGPVTQRAEEFGSEGETSLEKYKNRLHLWQVFFANPHEWRDCRKGKVNPNAPDFKHKGTGEALWLSRFDPPWVKRQLERHDSRMARGGLKEQESYLHLSPLVYDD